MSLATTRMLPSPVSRDASFDCKRERCSSVSAREVTMFQKISTRDDVLFTCCPPAPEDLETRTSSSLLGIDRDSSTARTFPDAAVDESVTPLPPAEQLERREERHEPPDQNRQHLR